MRFLKQNLGGILLCVFEILVGVLLLINPVAFTSGIIIAFGVVLIVMGIAHVVSYFRKDAAEAVLGRDLVNGLICLLIGIFCAFKSHWFVATFPVLAILYGVGTLLAGLGKVQWTVDMLRLKKGRWYLAALSAVVSIVCACVILANPFTTTVVLWIFTGISLIVEAVLDAVGLFLNRKNTAPAEAEE